jgi:hypothetical protein
MIVLLAKNKSYGMLFVTSLRKTLRLRKQLK